MYASHTTRWMLFLLVLLGIATTHGSARAAVMTFLDEGAWRAAIAGLPGSGQAQLPIVARLAPFSAVPLDRMTFSDAFGTWTHDDQMVDYINGDGFPETRTRAPVTIGEHPFVYTSSGEQSGAAATWDGGFFVMFYCYTAVYPCIGLRTIEIDLGREVLGFGGHLDYYKGIYGPSPIPLLADAYYSWPDPGPGLDPVWEFYHGFFGVIFDQPTKVIRLAWWEEYSMDDSSSVRFSNTLIIRAMPVPEPASIVLLAAALLGLLAVSRAGGSARGKGHVA